MRYPASEKLKIIRIVEKSHLPVRRTLEKLGLPRATFYRWYDLYRLGGIDALAAPEGGVKVYRLGNSNSSVANVYLVP